MHRTPHCTQYCGESTYRGKRREWHVHGNAKRKRFRKRGCKCDMCVQGRLRRKERQEPIEDA